MGGDQAKLSKSLHGKHLFMTQRERQILELVRQDPLISQQALAERLGISRSAVAVHLMHLSQKGYILGKGYILAPSSYVMVVGGANMDISAIAAQPLRMGDSNPGRVRTSPGGVARNIAENLGRLGVDCRLLTAVGDDPYGQTLLESTQRAGVNVRASLICPGQASSTYVSVHQPDGEMQVAFNDMAVLEALTPQALAAQLDALQQAAALVLDTNIQAETLAWLCSQCQHSPIFVDPVSAYKVERIRPWLGHIHTLKPNQLEAATLSGKAFAGLNEAPAQADWLHSEGVQQVVFSLGAEGVFCSDGQTQQHLPPIPVEVVNVTGAGDALMAGLVWGWLNQQPLVQAARFAQACAALTLGCESTNHPSLSPQLLARFMETSNES